MFYVNQRWLALYDQFGHGTEVGEAASELDEMATDGRTSCCPRRKSSSWSASASTCRPIWRHREYEPVAGCDFRHGFEIKNGAVREARKLGHSGVVAVVDTNCDPSEVDYVIPGNDDALIRLFASKISDSAAEGSQLMSNHTR